MPLDSEFLLEVKEHVSAKLKNLGAFIDEELPDYIMVMVANNKSESSMTKDLQLFLGDHTVEFTKWLHSLLDRLKRRGKSQSKEAEQVSPRDKVKPSKRRSSKSEASVTKEVQHVHRKSRMNSRSRSPVNRKSNDAQETREQRMNEGHFSTEDNAVVDNDISSSVAIKEERKVVSTASLSSKHHSEDDDAVIDSTQESSSLRSVVKLKQTEPKPRPKVTRNLNGTLQPGGRLLKQAVSEVKANVKPVVPPPVQSRITPGRRVEYGDVSSSGGNLDRRKFYVTLGGAERERSPSPPSDTSAASRWPLNDDRVHRAINVKARLGERRVLPYSIPERRSAKERLGPLTPSKITTDTMEFASDEIELAEPELDELDLVQEVSISEEPYSSPQQDSRTVDRGRLVDRLNQKHLIVTLNDADDDEDTAPLASDKLSATKNKGLTATGSIAQGDEQVKIPSPVLPCFSRYSSLERCRYWPKCRNGDQCQYIHPTEPCATFPRCRLGDQCVYIHPTCRYDASCTRADCPFAHSSKRGAIKPTATVLPSISPSQVVCRFQDRCTNSFCPFYHPPAQVLAIHPFSRQSTTVPCRFGAKCTNASCTFSHPDQPKMNQLKWVAPGKRPSLTGPPVAAGPTAPKTATPMK